MMEDNPFDFITQYLSDSPDDLKISKVVKIVQYYIQNRDLRDFNISICQILDLVQKSDYDKLQEDFKTYSSQILSSSKAAQLAQEQIIHYQTQLRMAQLNNQNLEDQSFVIQKQNKRFVSCLQTYYQKFNLEHNLSDDIENQLDFLILSQCSNQIENNQKLLTCDNLIQELQLTLQHQQCNHKLLETRFQTLQQQYLEQQQLFSKEQESHRTLTKHADSQINSNYLQQLKQKIKDQFSIFSDILLSLKEPFSQFCSLISQKCSRGSVVSNQNPVQTFKIIKETQTYIQTRNVGIQAQKDQLIFTEIGVQLDFVTTVSEYVQATKPPLIGILSRGKNNFQSSQPTNKEVLTDQLFTVDCMIQHNSEMNDFSHFVFFEDSHIEVKMMDAETQIHVYGDDKVTGTMSQISFNDKAVQSLLLSQSKFVQQSFDSHQSSLCTQGRYLTILEQQNKEYKQQLIQLSIHMQILENQLKANIQ